MSYDTLKNIEKYVAIANYLTVAQIYLQDNFFLQRPLSAEDIKPRLLGHWGTCPGINFVYAQLNYLIKKHKNSVLFILGPGHGYPALQANLFLEGTLQKYYPQAQVNAQGVAYLCKNFSWPFGFPTHSDPGTPGLILEGGELGYALSTAYGAALDNQDLLVACLIGDGEAETGPTAGAWHLNKFIYPATNGAVLPILHVNGYKISGPTIFGRMSDRELKMLFKGYGYTPFIVQDLDDIYAVMADTLEQCYTLIKNIQEDAKTRKRSKFHHAPMIILKTPKGWTGIKYVNGKKIEGNNLAHQVVIPDVKHDKDHLYMLEQWLKSYNFTDFFNQKTGLSDQIKAVIPEPYLCMGTNKHAYSGRIYQDLELPEIKPYAKEVLIPGVLNSNSMQQAGDYLKRVMALNKQKRIIRFFSPDEIYSNKLDALLEQTTRSFELPIKKWDKDLAPDGLVLEMLSEHNLQGLAQGYVLTGRHAIFASYEAFIEIVSSMVDQYVKFLRKAENYSWRGDCSSLTYILTSSVWRQEHNGFSHQNPSFIGGLLESRRDIAQAYFPPDGNSTLVVLKECLASKNRVNIIVAGKTTEPQWLTPELAQKEISTGIMIWNFASDANPDLVLACIGDYMTKEILSALDILKKEIPHSVIRCVNIITISHKRIGNYELTQAEFEYYFTSNKPVIINYHGYPATIKALLFNYTTNKRFTINGYNELGSTTTPFDMHIQNGTSRYHVVMQAVRALVDSCILTKEQGRNYIEKYTHKIEQHKKYIITYGVDPEEITQWQWKKRY